MMCRALTKRGALPAGALVVLAGAAAPVSAQSSGDPFAALPSKIKIAGVARDFRACNVAGGHPDFELSPPQGWGVYMGVVQDSLDENGKPVFKSTGYKVTKNWLDSQGRPMISPRSYIQPRPGDVPGACASSAGQVVTGAARYHEWYRDTMGVNVSCLYVIDLVRTPGTGDYIYDDRLDPHFAGGSGFFAVGGNGFPQGGNQNFNFTYELEAEFPYIRGTNQYFKVAGDDDVWAFVNGKLVMDVGGVHTQMGQTIELDRLTHLDDQGVYTLKVFFAERNKPGSHLRVETNLMLRYVEPPETAGLRD